MVAGKLFTAPIRPGAGEVRTLPVGNLICRDSGAATVSPASETKASRTIAGTATPCKSFLRDHSNSLVFTNRKQKARPEAPGCGDAHEIARLPKSFACPWAADGGMESGLRSFSELLGQWAFVGNIVTHIGATHPEDD